MPVTVLCSGNTWQHRITEKRQQLERARSAKVARLRQDIDRITKRECEHAKSVLDVIIPIKITWDDEAWKRIQEKLPVKVEYVEHQEKTDDATN
jgi:hypothetical protein